MSKPCFTAVSGKVHRLCAVSVREYLVQTATGDGFGSGTEAAVYVNIVGTLGDSGKRFLVHSMEQHDNSFDSGAVSEGVLCQ